MPSSKVHIGRRVQLVVWLQIMQEWIGIAGVTICKLSQLTDRCPLHSLLIVIHQDANDIFRQAQYSSQKARWIAGVNDITYMVCSETSLPLVYAEMPKLSTLVAVFTLDHLGRRKSLFWGSCIMGVSLFLSGDLSRLAINNPDQAPQFGAAAAPFTFRLYCWVRGYMAHSSMAVPGRKFSPSGPRQGQRLGG